MKTLHHTLLALTAAILLATPLATGAQDARPGSGIAGIPLPMFMNPGQSRGHPTDHRRDAQPGHAPGNTATARHARRPSAGKRRGRQDRRPDRPQPPQREHRRQDPPEHAEPAGGALPDRRLQPPAPQRRDGDPGARRTPVARTPPAPERAGAPDRP